MDRSRWWRSRARAGLGITPDTVVAVANGGGRRVSRRALPDGLVRPDALTPNISSVSELAQLAAAALEEVGARGASVALALPDLSLTTRVVHPAGRAKRRELETLFDESLPFPRSEARCDYWSGPGGAVVAAAVRTAVVRQYEQVVEAADCQVGWVDGACLAQLPRWSQALVGASGLHLRVVLEPASFCAAVFVDGKLEDVRLKLRPPTLAALRSELERIPALHGVDAASSVHFFGDEADELAEAYPCADVRADPAEPLSLALETLLERREP